MIIAITGAIGCGKSTVFQLFRQAAWEVFDSDAFCRKLYDENDATLASELRTLWGDRPFNGNGNLDRQKVADIVFDRPEELKKLTDIIFPKLLNECKKQRDKCRVFGRNGAFEVPLLYENHLEKDYDAVLAIWCDSDIRHQRLREFRHLSDNEILRREKNQMPPEEKMARADYVLINNGDLEYLTRQFRILLMQIDGNLSIKR